MCAPNCWFTAESCESPIDLSQQTSPYYGDTSLGTNTVWLGGGTASALDVVFTIEVQPNETFWIRQVDNSYDSVHELRVRGVCPGDQVVMTVDDPDTEYVWWTNYEDKATSVYYLQSGFIESSMGNFSLEWDVVQGGGVLFSHPSCRDLDLHCLKLMLNCTFLERRALFSCESNHAPCCDFC